MKMSAPFILALCLSGCGATQVLKPQAGANLPPKPAAARTAPTTEQMMTADDQSRPRRTDELLQKSEKRVPDKFDLPPPG